MTLIDAEKYENDIIKFAHAVEASTLVFQETVELWEEKDNER